MGHIVCGSSHCNTRNPEKSAVSALKTLLRAWLSRIGAKPDDVREGLCKSANERGHDYKVDAMEITY